MAQTYTVNIGPDEMAFNPPSLGITKGDTVVWINQMTMDHTVDPDNGEFPPSDHIPPKGTFTHTFPTTSPSGPVPYHCDIHPFMTGTVVVMAQANVDIGPDSMAFNPSSVTIAPGDTVVWTNKMTMDHTVDPDNGEFPPSDHIPPKGTFTHTFPTTSPSGPVPYHCDIHPFMKGTVVVK